MKKLFLVGIVAILLIGITEAGEINRLSGTIASDTLGTDINWTQIPEFTSGVWLYLNVYSTPTDAEFDTTWITLWTKHLNRTDSVTALGVAKTDTFTVLLPFDADSLAAGPNAKYQWGVGLGVKFVVRDSTASAAGKAFSVPLGWRIGIKGF